MADPLDFFHALGPLAKFGAVTGALITWAAGMWILAQVWKTFFR